MPENIISVSENTEKSQENQTVVPPAAVGQLKILLEENLVISRRLESRTKKIERWIFWQNIFGVIKILVIIVPIILALIYLPLLLKPLITTYGQLLAPNSVPTSSNTNILDQLRQQLP